MERPLSNKLNQEQKHARRVSRLAIFMQQYGRKARRALDPNDRPYDRRLERAVKRMPAEELDRLLRDDEEGPPRSARTPTRASA